MKLAFLLHDAYGIGGTIRAVINLAEALADRHDVELVSVTRPRAAPMSGFPNRVRLTSLVDTRRLSPDMTDERTLVRSKLVPIAEPYSDRYTQLTDERIGGYLRRTRAHILVGTRPSLNTLIAQLASDSKVKIAQEHMTYGMMPSELRADLRRHYVNLDASVSLTEPGAAAFRSGLGLQDLRILSIPNIVPDSEVPPSDCSSRIVMAAGRLVEGKRFDLLLRAFAKVVRERPDWSLRIYGDGPHRTALRSLLEDLELHNHVLLMGRQALLDPEWAKASIAVSSSDSESFGMTLVEAMRCGLPVASTSCEGPPEIIRDGQDGLLVPVGDADAIADALLELIGDDDRRRRMGRNAIEGARRFSSGRVVRAYENLFRELAEKKGMAYGNSRRSIASLAADGRRRFRTRIGRSVPDRVRVRLGRQPAGRAGAEANCTIDDNGRLSLTLKLPSLLAHGASIDCRRRDGSGQGRVGIPLVRTSSRDGAAWAVGTIDPSQLSEGRWDLYLETRLGRPRRIAAGVLDLRALANAREHPRSGPVVRVLPYRTVHNYLTVRSWVRPRHAEVTSLHYRNGYLSIEGWIAGVPVDGSGPRLVMVRKHAEHPLSVEATGTTTDGRTFRFDVPVQKLIDARLSRRDNWELWVSGHAGGEPARLARLFDEIAERKRVYVYPRVVLEDSTMRWDRETSEAQVFVTPYFNTDSELTLAVEDDARRGLRLTDDAPSLDQTFA